MFSLTTGMDVNHMKKQITVVLEVESDDEFMMTNDFIKKDLESEIACATNSYDVISITQEEITPNLDNLIHAIECETWATSQCEHCPYGYQYWDDSGDHGFWFHDDEKTLNDALFFLKQIVAQKDT